MKNILLQSQRSVGNEVRLLAQLHPQFIFALPL
jgi:hypothetical protein